MKSATSPIIAVGFSANGTVTWTQQDGDTYLVTGVDRSGRRFRRVCSSWREASCINVWRGSRWLLRGGRRFRINTVNN